VNNEKKFPEIRFKGFINQWEQQNIGDICEFYRGLTYSPADVTDSIGTLVLRSSNIKDGEIIDADNVYVDPLVVNCNNVSAGDVIVVVRNGSRNLIGKHAQIKKTMDNTVIGAFMTGLRPAQPEFTNALLDTPRFNFEVLQNLGATINQITNGAFKQMSFMVPTDKDEQASIGNFLRNIDDTIASKKQQHEQIIIIKKAMLEKTFPKKGANVPEIRFEGFVGAWETACLGECFTERVERSALGELLSVTINAGVVKASSLQRRDSSSDDKSNYKVVKIDDIAYNSMRMWQGASGYSRYDGIVSPAYTVVTPKNKMHSPFFACAFKRPEMILAFEKSSQGLTSDNWNLKFPAFSRINVAFPEVDEQTAIASFFRGLDTLIEAQREELEKLQNIKSACISKMLL